MLTVLSYIMIYPVSFIFPLTNPWDCQSNMHQRLKRITIMQCIVGNPMQIVLWKVVLNHVLGEKKGQKNKDFFPPPCFNCLFCGFLSSCQRRRFKRVVWHSAPRAVMLLPTGHCWKDGVENCGGFSMHVSVMFSFKTLIACQRKNLSECWSGTVKRNVSSLFLSLLSPSPHL